MPPAQFRYELVGDRDRPGLAYGSGVSVLIARPFQNSFPGGQPNRPLCALIYDPVRYGFDIYGFFRRGMYVPFGNSRAELHIGAVVALAWIKVISRSVWIEPNKFAFTIGKLRQSDCWHRTSLLEAPAYAPVAQLDRALPSEGRGQGFESLRVRHFFIGFLRFCAIGFGGPRNFLQEQVAISARHPYKCRIARSIRSRTTTAGRFITSVPEIAAWRLASVSRHQIKPALRRRLFCWERGVTPSALADTHPIRRSPPSQWTRCGKRRAPKFLA